jgi:hypothetical protein
VDDRRRCAARRPAFNRCAFWLAVLIGLGALFHIGRRRAPVRLHAEYRGHLRRAHPAVFGCDGSLGRLRPRRPRPHHASHGNELTSDAIITLASLPVEIKSVAVVIVMIAKASRLMARTAGSFDA